MDSGNQPRSVGSLELDFSRQLHETSRPSIELVEAAIDCAWMEAKTMLLQATDFEKLEWLVIQIDESFAKGIKDLEGLELYFENQMKSTSNDIAITLATIVQEFEKVAIAIKQSVKEKPSTTNQDVVLYKESITLFESGFLILRLKLTMGKALQRLMKCEQLKKIVEDFELRKGVMMLQLEQKLRTPEFNNMHLKTRRFNFWCIVRHLCDLVANTFKPNISKINTLCQGFEMILFDSEKKISGLIWKYSEVIDALECVIFDFECKNTQRVGSPRRRRIGQQVRTTKR